MPYARFRVSRGIFDSSVDNWLELVDFREERVFTGWKAASNSSG